MVYTELVHAGSALLDAVAEASGQPNARPADALDAMRECAAIQPDWLHELAPHFYDFGTVCCKLMQFSKHTPYN